MRLSRKGDSPSEEKGLSPSVSCKIVLALALLTSLVLGGCREPQKMGDQPYYEPFEGSEFFADGLASRHPPEGTVARGARERGTLFYTGKIGGKLADAFPFPVTRQVLERGRERYDIFCSPCHDRVGTGVGMIVRRGYRQPPSFHSEKLRKTPAGEFFEHITFGFGAMPSYAAQIRPEDRWAVVTYIRALQLSRNARLADLAPEDRRKLEEVK